MTKSLGIKVIKTKKWKNYLDKIEILNTPYIVVKTFICFKSFVYNIWCVGGRGYTIYCGCKVNKSLVLFKIIKLKGEKYGK
jgi:hypothetical protein